VARSILLVSRAVSALCLTLLAALVVFDAQAERFTAGLTPAQFREQLEVELLDEYPGVLGVAHNAGDDLGATFEAVAHDVDAVEIDVRSVGGELHASHDAPVPFVDTLFFRGPHLEEAWEAARLSDTIVLDLKESSRGYLERVRRFVSQRRDRRLIIQTQDAPSLRILRRTVPWAQRQQLIFTAGQLEELRNDRGLVAVLDGVSVRDRLLTVGVHAWLEQRGLRTFAWTVNDDRRMNELVERGLDGLITDRLDIMALLAGRRDLT